MCVCLEVVAVGRLVTADQTESSTKLCKPDMAVCFSELCLDMSFKC